MKKILFIAIAAVVLAGCTSVPPKIKAAIDGNLKTATEFETLYKKLIDCKTQEEVSSLWETEAKSCKDCKDADEHKTHQKVKLGANVVRAKKLSDWANGKKEE